MHTTEEIAMNAIRQLEARDGEAHPDDVERMLIDAGHGDDAQETLDELKADGRIHEANGSYRTTDRRYTSGFGGDA